MLKITTTPQRPKPTNNNPSNKNFKEDPFIDKARVLKPEHMRSPVIDTYAWIDLTHQEDYTTNRWKPTNKFIFKTQQKIVKEHTIVLSKFNGFTEAFSKLPFMYPRKIDYNCRAEGYSDVQDIICEPEKLEDFFLPPHIGQGLKNRQNRNYYDIKGQIQDIEFKTEDEMLNSEWYDYHNFGRRPIKSRKVVVNNYTVPWDDYAAAGILPFPPKYGEFKVVTKKWFTREEVEQLENGDYDCLVGRGYDYHIPQNRSAIPLGFNSRRTYIKSAKYLGKLGIKYHVSCQKHEFRYTHKNGKICLKDKPLYFWVLYIPIETVDFKYHPMKNGKPYYSNNINLKEATIEQVLVALAAKIAGEFNGVLLDKLPIQHNYREVPGGKKVTVEELLDKLKISRNLEYTVQKYMKRPFREFSYEVRGVSPNFNKTQKLYAKHLTDAFDSGIKITHEYSIYLAKEARGIIEKMYPSRWKLTDRTLDTIVGRMDRRNRKLIRGIAYSKGSPVLTWCKSVKNKREDKLSKLCGDFHQKMVHQIETVKLAKMAGIENPENDLPRYYWAYKTVGKRKYWNLISLNTPLII